MVNKPSKEDRRRQRTTTTVPTNQIRNWRLYRKFENQVALAKAAKLAPATVSRLESGRIPYNERMLKRLAAVLNCKESDLLDQNPFEMASIFKIYYDLPLAKRQKLERLAEQVKKE